MAGFNFSQIGKIIGEIMDTDKIDVSRKRLIEMPNGSWKESNIEQPIYENISCHLSFNTSDKPNTENIDVQNILKTIVINCDISVDLKEGDLITAYKMDSLGCVLEMYKGIIGQPETNQSRKSTIMEVRTL